MDKKHLELKDNLHQMLNGMMIDAAEAHSSRDLWNILMVLQEKINRAIIAYYNVQ